MFAKDIWLTPQMKMIFWLTMLATLNNCYNAAIFNHFNIRLFNFAVEAKRGEQAHQHAIEWHEFRLTNWACFSVNPKTYILKQGTSKNHPQQPKISHNHPQPS